MFTHTSKLAARSAMALFGAGTAYFAYSSSTDAQVATAAPSRGGTVVDRLTRIEDRLTSIENSSQGGAIGDKPTDLKSTRAGLHRVYPELVELLQSANPRSVGKKRSPTETHVIRIALTGGPCAGKSSALSRLADTATQKGFDVYVAPECATILFNSGAKWVDTPLFQLEFMKSIVQLQLQLERSFTRIAASTGRPSIIVYDRGILDNKGYISTEGWQQTLEFVSDHDKNADVTEEYVLGRYDGVIHMVTAAKGAEKYYKHGWTTDDSGHKVFRRETPQMARDADDKMITCWSAHPHHTVVGNGASGFDGKLQQVVDAVMAIAEAKHPSSESTS